MLDRSVGSILSILSRDPRYILKISKKDRKDRSDSGIGQTHKAFMLCSAVSDDEKTSMDTSMTQGEDLYNGH